MVNLNTSSKNDYKKGDFLIDFGQVFKIIKVENIKTANGPDKLLIFKPYYKTQNESEITSSLPVKNIDRTTIRKPLSKKELQAILAILSSQKIKAEVVDVLTAKSMLNLNDPKLAAETIRKLYLEKINQDLKFTSSKKYVYQLLISRLAEEVALVYKLDLDKAIAKVEKKLKK